MKEKLATQIVRFPLALRVLSERFRIRCLLSVRLRIEQGSAFVNSFLAGKSSFQVADDADVDGDKRVYQEWATQVDFSFTL